MSLIKASHPWETVPFESAVVDFTGGQPKVQKQEYLTSGSLPVIDQGQAPIAGYTNDCDSAYKGPLPVVLFGDHTRIFKYVDFPFALGADGVKVLVPKRPFNPKFLFFYFQSVQMPSRGYSRHFKFLKELYLPFFPASEQQRIVEILDQADALRKKRGEADAKALGIMRALFTNIFGRPDEWTSSDNASPLASLVEIHSGGTPSKKNPDFWEGEVPWISPKDMKQDILYDSAEHVSPFAAKQANLKYINPGTVLIVVRGMILVHTVPIALAGTRLTINQDIKALELKSTDIDSIYLYAALRVSDRMILSKVRTAAHGTRKIDTEELLQLPVLIPSRNDSDRFCRMITQYNGTISRTIKTRGMIERLFENLLDHAFSGDLTAKWREGHMKELLGEMREQTKYLAPHGAHKQRENAVQQESLF